MNEHPAIIIKKVKKGGGHGHHGGAWKVAYADFVTAMMAFFLLMWLLNATSEEQKRGISNYFGPVGMASGASGTGGVLGGLSISSEGSFSDSKSSPAITLSTPKSMNDTDGEVRDISKDKDLGEAEKGKGKDQKKQELEKSGLLKREITDADDLSNSELKKELAERDEEIFEQMEKEILQAIQEMPEIKDLSENIIIDQTPEGLQIQLVDQDKKSMFPLGSSEMHAQTRELLAQVGKIIRKIPNKISVSGHTDSKPYADGKNYSNWELSTDRANSSRRELMRQGVQGDRVSYVVGKADNDPLIKKDPYSPQNRRISIVLMRLSAEVNASLKGPQTKDSIPKQSSE